MIKARAWWLAAVAALAMTGCGKSAATTASFEATPTATVASSNAFPGALSFGAGLTDATGRRFGLGAILEGTPVVTYDEGALSIQAEADALPAKVDLRPRMSPVRNQGNFGSCTGFALISGLREALLIKEGRPFTQLSPGHMWYLERKEHGWPTENKGAHIFVGMKILDNLGVATEADFPYTPLALKNPEKLTPEEQQALQKALELRPTPQQIEAGKKFRVAGRQATNSLRAIRKSLAAGYPVVIGIALFESFQQVGADGMVPLPKAGEKMLGGHAVTISGYDTTRKLLIVKNSWSAQWGDQGYFYLPYEYLKMGLGHDAWTAKLS